MDVWPPRLRSCTSENGLSQEARILALLEEMRPARRPREQLFYNSTQPIAPPNYHTIYPTKQSPLPPSYGDVVRVAPSRAADPQHSPSDSTLSRCSARQASFMAAVRNGEERQRRREAQARRRTTVYGDEVYSSAGKENTNDLSRHDVNHNEEKMISRRGRPKSYVLATSASLPETDPSSFSHDDTSRDMSSMGSLSSIEPSTRSVQPAQSTKSLQKFIALFQKDGKGRLRPKRSRTSMPENRNPLPEPSLPLNRVVRQGWLKHQEVILGKKGSRSQWNSRWTVLADTTLYLCMQPSICTGESLQLIAPVSRLDVASSVVDIAYDWLSQARHVLRLVCQSRSEHLFELLSEAEMLSWITALQSASSPEPPASVLANSCSAASLASTCSSDRHVAVPCPATNQLIMHRYKAKSSQLQSPSSKRASDHITQPGTSKENNTENGEATTPKSARKWKKSKANKQGSGSSGGSGPAPSILGIRLAECVTSDPDEHIPLVVQICVTVVEEHGMDTVGIYRIPGNTAAVNGLKDHLSQNIEAINIETMDFSDSRWRDVNVVSSFLKMFLRKLPEPLLTDKLYPFFIDANRIPSHHNRLHKLRNLLRKLPRPHYCTLRYLIRHLSAISKNSEINKMETRNVALMFGPSIVRPSDDNMATMVTHMSDQCKIIETLIHYHEWMFDDNSLADDMVPSQHPSEIAETRTETAQYGVVNPGAVSAATFNDMHMLIRKANEEQALAMMNEGKAGKIKNILRRNSRRDKSKGKPKIESTAPAAVHPRYTCTPPQSSVDSAFLGNYQERDIDAEIMSRQTVSPLASTVEQSPSIESSLGSLPDTSRTDPGPSENHAEEHKRRQLDMYSARRIFIAGTADAAPSSVDALTSHTQHLNTASSPALEVLSEETRAKIRKMQLKQSWIEPSRDCLKANSPTKDHDAVSCTSDYSTTSSAPLTTPLAVACSGDHPTSSDYASSFSDPSPCANASSPRRPNALVLNEHSRCQQKIKMRNKTGSRDPSRRHTLSDMDTFKEGRLEKFARWIGLRRSSPDVTKEDPTPLSNSHQPPPTIIRTSPNELTPASGDEQL